MATSTNAIPRVSKETPESQLQTLTMSILTTAWRLTSVQGLAPLSGQGELDRLIYPVGIFNSGIGESLLVSRHARDEVDFPCFDQIGLEVHCGLTRYDGVKTETSSTNTLEQVTWVMDKAKDLGLQSVALFTAPYHITRAFATAVHWFDRTKADWFPVVPISVGELDKPVPELTRKGVLATGANMVAGEIERYFEYASAFDKQGQPKRQDVASCERVQEYMTWMRLKHKEMYWNPA